MSPYIFLAFLTVSVHTGAESHRGWRCTFFVPTLWVKSYILAEEDKLSVSMQVASPEAVLCQQ